MTSDVVVNGVTNLSAGNIKKGVTVGGVLGTWEGYVPVSGDIYYKGAFSSGFNDYSKNQGWNSSAILKDYTTYEPDRIKLQNLRYDLAQSTIPLILNSSFRFPDASGYKFFIDVSIEGNCRNMYISVIAGKTVNITFEDWYYKIKPTAFTSDSKSLIDQEFFPVNQDIITGNNQIYSIAIPDSVRGQTGVLCISWASSRTNYNGVAYINRIRYGLS